MSANDLIAIRHLEKEEIAHLIATATDFKARVNSQKEVPQHKDQVLGLLFFENSTRTRVSFEMAAHYLGLKTCTFSAGSSSMSKGETLKDTILTLKHERLTGLVIRHKASGAPALASRFFGGPIVNAGDGWHEHPTQALGDALTIIERKGKLEGLNVAIVGDVMHSRVARSNAWLLSKMGANIRLVGPRTLLPTEMSALPGEVFHELESTLEDADVVMTLRLQKERMEGGLLSSIGEYADLYQVNAASLRYAKPDVLVMHPGPINRGVEVDDQAADGDNSVITHQIENGIFVRMAALHIMFAGSEEKATKGGKKK